MRLPFKVLSSVTFLIFSFSIYLGEATQNNAQKESNFWRGFLQVMSIFSQEDTNADGSIHHSSKVDSATAPHSKLKETNINIQKESSLSHFQREFSPQFLNQIDQDSLLISQDHGKPHFWKTGSPKKFLEIMSSQNGPTSDANTNTTTEETSNSTSSSIGVQTTSNQDNRTSGASNTTMVEDPSLQTSNSQGATSEETNNTIIATSPQQGSDHTTSIGAESTSNTTTNEAASTGSSVTSTPESLSSSNGVSEVSAESTTDSQETRTNIGLKTSDPTETSTQSSDPTQSSDTTTQSTDTTSSQTTDPTETTSDTTQSTETTKIDSNVISADLQTAMGNIRTELRKTSDELRETVKKQVNEALDTLKKNVAQSAGDISKQVEAEAAQTRGHLARSDTELKNKINDVAQKVDQTTTETVGLKLMILKKDLKDKEDELEKIQKEIAELKLKVPSQAPSICSTKTDCDVCTQDPRCGWCIAEKKCVDGDKIGPLYTSCNFYDYGKCSGPACGRYKDCDVIFF